MRAAIEVHGSYGTLYVDPIDGKVVDYEPGEAGDDYKNIASIDLDEWRRYYKAEPCGPLNLLDVAYTTDEGFYSPHVKEWRELMESLAGPMGKPVPGCDGYDRNAA